MTTSHVLTLVASSNSSPLAPSLAAEALGPIAARTGARVGEPIWLADDIACDLPIAFPDLTSPDSVQPDLAAAENAVRQALGDDPVDVALQPTAGRRKRLLVADMESTIIRNEMLDELADFADCRQQVEEITARAMNGELDFRAALDERVGLLSGLSTKVLEASMQRLEITAGAATLVATLRAHGVYTALVSGGFTYFTERVKERLGFDEQEANQLEIEGGRLTGRVLEPLKDRAAKLRALERLCGERGLIHEDAATVGDGANDLSMLEAAGLGVAFHAKPSVAQVARFRIEYGDLTTLLYFQGYAQADLVEA